MDVYEERKEIHETWCIFKKWYVSVAPQISHFFGVLLSNLNFWVEFVLKKSKQGLGFAMWDE